MLKLLNENYVLDSECLNLLVKHLQDYIFYYYKKDKLFEKGFNIYLHNDCFRTTYHNHVYNISIVKVNDLFHYYLQHKNEYHIIVITSPQTFNIVITKIKEIDKRQYKAKSV